MSGHHPWAELRAKLYADPERRARIEEGARAIHDGYELVRLRAELGLPEIEVDDEDEMTALDDSGDDVTSDALGSNEEEEYIATLRSFVESIGGRLEVNAIFQDATMSLLPGRRWIVSGSDRDGQPDSKRGRVVAQVR